MHRRNFITALLAAPIAAVTAHKAGKLWGVDRADPKSQYTSIIIKGTETGRFSGREFEKWVRHAHHYGGMGPGRIVEVTRRA
jgi:hypothetical protein